MVLISHSGMCTWTHTKTYRPASRAPLNSDALGFITGPFPRPNTRTGVGDEACAHSPLWTTSHLSRGNWKEREKGEASAEVKRTADEG